MLHSFFRYLQGYLRIKIIGYSPERFVNLCKNRSIDIWGLGYTLHSYEMYIKVKDFKKLKPILKKTSTKVSIVERCGLPFFFHHYRKRKCFFAGIVICLSLIYFMTFFIWRIDLKGNQMITDEVLIEYLESTHVYHGMLRKKVDCEQIVKDIRKHFDDIIWVSASLDGTCLSVHVKENTDTFHSTQEEETAGDIIADKAGIVVSIVTRSGVPKVAVGDEVQMGDLLVSGTMEVLNDAKEVASTYYVNADADIVLETAVHYEDQISKQYQKKEYTDKKRYIWFVDAKDYHFGFGIPQNSFSYAEQHTVKQQLQINEHFYLPISIGRKKILEYEWKTLVYSESEMANLLNERFETYCKNLEKNAIILEKHLQITQEQDGAKATATLMLQETAGINRKIVDF